MPMKALRHSLSPRRLRLNAEKDSEREFDLLPFPSWDNDDAALTAQEEETFIRNYMMLTRNTSSCVPNEHQGLNVSEGGWLNNDDGTPSQGPRTCTSTLLDTTKTCKTVNQDMDQRFSQSKKRATPPLVMHRSSSSDQNTMSSKSSRNTSQISLTQDAVTDVTVALQKLQDQLQSSVKHGKRVSRVQVLGALLSVVGKLDVEDHCCSESTPPALEGTIFGTTNSKATKITVNNRNQRTLEEELSIKADDLSSGGTSRSLSWTDTFDDDGSSYSSIVSESASLSPFIECYAEDIPDRYNACKASTSYSSKLNWRKETNGTSTNSQYSPSMDQEGWNALFKDLVLYPFACLAPTFPSQLKNPCQPMKITKPKVSWLKSARRQGPRSERMPITPSRKDETEAETSTDDGLGTLFHDIVSPFICMASKASPQEKEQAQYRLQVVSKQFDTPAVLSVNEVPVPQRHRLKQILFERRFFSFSSSRRNSKESIHLESDKSLSPCSVNRTTQLESSGGPSDPTTQAVPRAASNKTSHIKVNFDVASTHEKASNEIGIFVDPCVVVETTLAPSEDNNESLLQLVDLNRLRSKTLAWDNDQNQHSGTGGLQPSSMSLSKSLEYMMKGVPCNQRTFQALKSFRKRKEDTEQLTPRKWWHIHTKYENNFPKETVAFISK